MKTKGVGQKVAHYDENTALLGQKKETIDFSSSDEKAASCFEQMKAGFSISNVFVSPTFRVGLAYLPLFIGYASIFTAAWSGNTVSPMTTVILLTTSQGIVQLSTFVFRLSGQIEELERKAKNQILVDMPSEK